MRPARAGDFRHVLVYQTPTETTDELGQGQKTWSNYGPPFRAKVSEPTGRDALNAQQMKVEISHVIELWNPGFDLTPGNRLVEGTKTYNIAYAFPPDNVGRTVKVLAIELVNARNP